MNRKKQLVRELVAELLAEIGDENPGALPMPGNPMEANNPLKVLNVGGPMNIGVRPQPEQPKIEVPKEKPLMHPLKKAQLMERLKLANEAKAQKKSDAEALAEKRRKNLAKARKAKWKK